MPLFVQPAAGRLREFNKDQPRDPKGAPDKNGDGRGDGGQFAKGTSSGFDPAKRETWTRRSAGWHKGPDGEAPYGWHAPKDDDGYTVPAQTHTVPRIPGFGLWGGSHEGSTLITGESAAIMGITAYRTYKDTGAVYTKVAQRMLEEIAVSPGSEEPLYHAFQNVSHTRFTPGDTLRLPLTATAGEPNTTYGIRAEQEDQMGPPVVFVFPPGTKMMAYNKWPTDPKQRDYQDGNAQEFGHVYAEAVVAGRFRVTRTEVRYFGSQHARGGTTGDQVPQLYGQVVHLEPTGFYNTATRRWEQ